MHEVSPDWSNIHLPLQGNLEDLLGVVPPYNPHAEDEKNRTRIPSFNADAEHPYHLVVVYVTLP